MERNKNNWDGKKNVTKKITTIGEYEKEGKKRKKKVTKNITTQEIRYYISSRNVNIEEFAEVIRKHWQVENNLHWHLDFTFRQDDNRTINKKALLNLEIIHKFVLGVLNRVKSRYSYSLKNIRKHLSNNIQEFFPELLCYLMLHK